MKAVIIAKRIWKRRRAFCKFLAEAGIELSGCGICVFLILAIYAGYPLNSIIYTGLIASVNILAISSVAYFICGGKLHNIHW